MPSPFESLVDLPVEIRNKLASYTDGLGTADIDAASLTTALMAPGVLAASAAGRALMATDYFDAATVLAKIADGAFAANADTRALFADAIWTTAKLAAGILSADAAGRALVASDFFDATTALAKFATDSVTNAVLLKAVADGAFLADSATRALFADGIWPAAKLAAASVTPAKVDASTYFVMAEDFPLAAGGTLPAPLAKDVQADATGDYLADTANGVYSLATAVTSEAEAAQLTWGNQLMIDPTKGPIFEARVRVNFPGATITADERWVVGLCGDHTNSEDALDDVVSNIWFRGEGANLNIFVEGDDGSTDTDDLDTTVDYADNTWMLLKIDMTNKAAVVFSINGTAFGTPVNVTALSGSTLLQPIFCYQRDAGDEINLLEVDWFRVYQTR